MTIGARALRLRPIPPESGRFIALLAAAAPDDAVVEIGTSGGDSALWLALACRERATTLTTYELLDAKVELAAGTFRLAEVADGVALVAGDALSHTATQGAIGFCFLDAEKEIAADLFAAMGIAWEDKARRQDWAMRGFQQFDAPVSIVVTVDKTLEESTVAYFDLGAATYGLVLAAWQRGLGTVINGQGIMQSSVVREHAQIPADEIIVTCVAMGYPLDDFAANDVKSSRRPTESVVSYVGFED